MLERELKLAAPEGFRLPGLDGVADGLTATTPEELALETTYYDTAELRLARWGCSLRWRAGEGWTLKLPDEVDGALLTRRELTFDGEAAAPPDAAFRIVRAYLRQGAVLPVARLSTMRTRVRLLTATGERAAEVVADEVTVVEGEAGLRFRELEVELGEAGDERLLRALAARLRAAGAGASAGLPKHARALGARAMAPPDVVVEELARNASAAAVIRAALARSVLALLRGDPGVRLGEEPEHVHEARVATRRLRADLRTFRPLLDEDWAEGLRAELRWLGDAFGAVRDREVLLGRLNSRVGNLPEKDTEATGRLLERLTAEIAEARAALLAALDEERYLALVGRLVEAARTPLFVPDAKRRASRALPPLAARPWRRLQAAVEALPAAPTDAAWHEVRIRTKACRYAAEALAPIAGKRAAALASAAAAVQAALGEYHDAVTARAWLRSAAAEGGVAFAAGELAMLEAAAAQAALAHWPERWRALRHKELHAWLH